MTHRPLFVATTAAATTLAAYLLLGAASVLPGPQDDVLAAADRAFAEKTYAAALERYRAVLKEPAAAAFHDRAALRVGECLHRLGKFDDALAAFGELASRKPGAAVARAALLERGVVALTMPHDLYEKNGERTRGEWVQGAVYRSTESEDLLAGTADLEAAAGDESPLAGGGAAGASRVDRRMRVRAFLELAAGCEALEERGIEPPPSRVDAGAPAYRGAKSFAARRRAAFDAAAAVCVAANDGDAEALAVYLRAQSERRRLSHYRRRNGAFETADGAGGFVPLPKDADPLAWFAAAREKARGRAIEDAVRFAEADALKEYGEFVAAVAAAKSLREAFPKSIYAGDAALLIEELTTARLDWTGLPTAFPDRAATRRFATRNLREVGVEIYRTDPRTRIDDDFLEEAEAGLVDFDVWLKESGWKADAAARVASFAAPTPDRGDHAPVEAVVEFPPLPRGHYVVRATGASHVRLFPLVVSDLGLVAKVDGENYRVFAADALTGRPVAGAEVVVRERWTTKGLFGTRWVERHVRGTTDRDGLFLRRHEREPGEYSLVEAAVLDGERLAFAPPQNRWNAGGDARATRAYVMTDRPLYRPGDDVRFAVQIAAPHAEGWKAVAGKTVGLEIRDAKGGVAFRGESRTDDEGLLTAAFRLGKEPPLGEYSVVVKDGRVHLRRSTFRVEEYLKPEFEIRVERPQTELRLGDPASATIALDYLAGGGVAGAAVSWRVLREPWTPTFRRDEPWRAFYGEPVEDRGPASAAAGRVLVASGAGTADSTGRLAIAFPTAAAPGAGGDDREAAGVRFVVQVEATDPARRTLSSEDDLVVAARGLSFDLRPARGFFVVGESLAVELQSVFTGGGPAPVAGTFRLFRVKPGRPAAAGRPEVPEERTEVLSTPGRADALGIGVFRAVVDQGGLYAVTFEARDRFENLCTTERRFWVYGSDFRGDGFAMKNLELVPARRIYRPGESAAILLHAAVPDAAVFVTVEVGRRVLHAEVVRLAGTSALLELPIVAAHAPNVFVHVAALHGGEAFEETLELFVPPTDRFLDVAAEFAAPSFRPGETGALRVSTRDAAGAPVSARVVASVLDAALFYIQGDDAPDVRRFFYGDRRYAGVDHVTSTRWSSFGFLVVAEPKYGEHPSAGGVAAATLQPGRATRLLAGDALGVDELRDWSAPGDKGGFLGGVRRAFGAADAPAPSTPGALRESKALGEEAVAGRPARDDEDAGDALASVRLRTDFRDLALWTTEVRTGADGRAEIKVPFPENATAWAARVFAFGPGMAVGEASTRTRTAKALVARLRAPRYFVEGDVVTVTATVNRPGAAAGAVATALEIGGDAVLEVEGPLKSSVDVAAGGSARLDWRVRVVRAGEAVLRFRAAGSDDSDGIETRVPAYEWGAEKRVFASAVLADDAAADLVFPIPEARRVETTRLTVRLTPSLVVAVADALPYLVEFPYGCTEQTISRFAPAAFVARALRDAGSSLDEIAAHRPPDARSDRQGLGRKPAATNADLEAALTAGLRRLRALRQSDGGFGWFAADRSDPHLTALVLRGLVVAREAGVDVDAALVDGAAAFLARALPDDRRLETVAFGVYALALAGRPAPDVAAKVFAERDRLSVYGRALLASALHRGGRAADARLVVAAFDDVARADAGAGIVHFGGRTGGYWSWWDSGVETNAAVLEALLDVAPTSPHAAPLARWLLLNRRGSRWTSTRDTAAAVYALVRYARATGELDPDLVVEADLPDGTTKSLRAKRAGLFAFAGTLELRGDAVPAGDARVRLRTKGRGRVYATGEASFFTREDAIAPAGRDLAVERAYYLVRTKTERREVDGRVADVVAETFEPLADGATVAAGDVVEVRLVATLPVDYEHLLFEDVKPAGFEPLEVRSGGRYADGICSEIEFRDRRTALFATWLQAGRHELKYRLRAELPGELRAPPARGEAMYAPDVGANSASIRLRVADEGPAGR